MELQTLLLELENSAETINDLVAGLTAEEARARPSADAWSVIEVMSHLVDEEREDFRQRLDIMLNRPTEKLPPIDPEGWVSARKYKERDVKAVLESFLQERGKSLAWLKGLANPNWDAEYTTPFRTMRAGDMLASWVAHDNLAIRQLVELRRAHVVKMTAPYDVRYAGEW